MLGRRSPAPSSPSWPGACSVPTLGLSSRAKTEMQLEGKGSFQTPGDRAIKLGRSQERQQVHAETLKVPSDPHHHY